MSENRISMELLDEYCLRRIFRYLAINDKLNVAKCCRHFQRVIEDLIPAVEVNFNFIYEALTYPIAEDIFESFGPFIKKIFMQFDAVDEMVPFYYLVPKHCHNIEQIHYNFPYYVDTEIMEMMFKASPKIKRLHCNARELQDCHSLLISRLTELQYLNVDENRDVTGLHLNKLTKLEEMSIQGCIGIESKHFIEICLSTKFRTLNIIECELLDDGAFETLINTQSELQELAISHYYEHGAIEKVAHLPNLRSIRIDYMCRHSQKNNDLLSLLAQYQSDSIQVLEIARPNSLTQTDRNSILKFKNLLKIMLIADHGLDDNFLSQLSKSCCKLKEVVISESSNVTASGVADLVKYLKDLSSLDLRRCGQFSESLFPILWTSKMEANVDKPLKLFVWGTSIKEHVKIEDYESKKKLLELSFDFRF